MSDTGNLAMELAERRVEQERDTSVARVQASLAHGSGASDCIGCGVVIPEARRRALPNADTCIDCAQQRETRRPR